MSLPRLVGKLPARFAFGELRASRAEARYAGVGLEGP
jgi:hypothetical protein